MADWVRVYGGRNKWGAKIQRGMRLKDLPEDLKMCTKRSEGALEPLRFEGGKFYHVTWNQKHPLDWPEPTLTEVMDGDWLMEESDGGIALALGQYHGQEG